MTFTQVLRLTAAAQRLSLDPTLCRRGIIDGAWWPHSDSAEEELPALIAELDHRLDTTILRVGLHPDAWTRVPRRIAAPGRIVRVGWFHSIDVHMVSLHMVRSRDNIKLLVIPPATTEAVAAIAFGLATRGERSDAPAEILTISRAVSTGATATLAAAHEAEQTWANDGGQMIADQRL